ncbi:MAG: DM13 domain-containing protein [Flammeovirgaceae bacterium]|nr:MAG: DM13 domain-containing protein [Flammeovirgaceae bacterium]
MKKSILIFLLGFAMACNPDEATPTTPVNDDFDETKATLLREGTWMGSGSYNVSGVAQIYDDNGKKVLLLNNFSSSNGPDLRVYLSTTTGAASFVNLGKLKSTSGKQTYSIPDGTDITQFKFALIWCQQFSVLFGKAETL